MPLGTNAKRRTNTRKLAGNLDDQDITDIDIDVIIDRADNWMETQTNKFDWTSADQSFDSALTASNLMASAEILDGHPGVDSAKVEGQRRAARDIIKAINRKDTDIQATSGKHLDVKLNITNELDPLNYIPDQTLPVS